MSNFEILEGKLNFLRSFYHATTEPFRETKRKIDAHEEPFVANGDPEYYDEPPFLSEWGEADEGLKLQQQVCLTLLQRSFREFLDSTVHRHPDYPKSKPKKGSWFDAYQAWFLNELSIDWQKAPVSLARIEELSLARNCVQHGGESPNPGPKSALDSHALLKMQSEDYHARFPDGFFANEFEKGIWQEQNFPQPVEIELTPDKLETAIGDILGFCRFIDERLPLLMY